MPLDAGTRLGGYEVIGLLGAGGMGEVYRARDVRLGRDVALKVLPPAFAADADRRARFEREARALAALNHPNIAHLYGLVESGSTCAIVMELVEGDDLGARLSRGPIPSSEAFQIARQIAEALEAAHQGNIIHRDLKPANVRVRGDGTVKVLDFGLAKALDPPEADTAGAMSSRTVTANVTHLGGIVGTAAYMAPEQATGRPLDARADIWAFGCVLFEMLTGRRAFAGGSVTEILAAVVRDEPKWDLLPRDAARVAPLLRRTLRKDIRNRTHHAADLRIELDEVLADPVGSASETTRRRFFSPIVLALGSGLAIATFAAGVAVGLSRRETTPAPEASFHFQLPYGSPTLRTGGNLVGAISPTGAHYAYSAPEGTVHWLWIREFATKKIVKVPGSEGAYQPFWAPDAKRLAFFAGKQLLLTDSSGQPAIEIATVGGTPPRGATWSGENVILFTTGGDGGQRAAGRSAIRRVHASGGAVTVLMEGMRRYPAFLPDGRHFLFLEWAQTGENSVYLGNLDGTDPKRLFGSDSSFAVVPGPAVLFVRNNRLLYQQLDPLGFTPIGDPALVAEDVDVVPDSAAAQFAVGGNALLYRSGRVENRFHWADERGHRLGGIETDPIRFGAHGFSLAPTDDRAAMTRVAPGNAFNDVWVLNLQSGALSPETSGPEGEGWPCWSADGRRIAFSRQGQLVTKVVGSSERERTVPGVRGSRCAWMPDGARMVVQRPTGSLGLVDLLTGKVRPLEAFKNVGTLEDVSEDGQLVAYTSEETGRSEVWVSRLDGTGPVRQVTSSGGRLARWSRTGRDLFYVSDTQTFKVAISGIDLTVSKPVPLFDTVSPSEVMSGWDVARDGRFLLSVTDRRTVLQGILHWRSAIPRHP